MFAIDNLEKSLDKFLLWTDSHGWCGYDPYDALSSPMFHLLDRCSSFAGRLSIQALRYSPVNFRSILGIYPTWDSKTLGLATRGYIRLWHQTHCPFYWSTILALLQRLECNKVSNFSGACWAHPFPYRSRRGIIPANSPSIVSTYYPAQALLDVYEETHDSRWLDIVRSAIDFLLKDLKRIGNQKEFCFSYMVNNELSIHNANLLAVQLIARFAKVTQNHIFFSCALPALYYTLNDQNSDGSWYYDGPQFRTQRISFIDGFHTGFVLESLFDIMSDTGIDLRKSIEVGLNFYIEKLFVNDGRPRRTLRQSWPVDLRDCAQAIIVLIKALKIKNSELAQRTLKKVFSWTIFNMQSKHGYFFFYRNHGFYSPIPYIRFQAWMLCALTEARSYFEDTGNLNEG